MTNAKWWVPLGVLWLSCGAEVPTPNDDAGSVGEVRDGGLARQDAGSLPVDAGPLRDAGAPLDAGDADAGATDAAVADAGPAPTLDAGAPDSGAPDAGATVDDAGEPAMEDGGSPRADAGVADAGPADAGASHDAGTNHGARYALLRAQTECTKSRDCGVFAPAQYDDCVATRAAFFEIFGSAYANGELVHQPLEEQGCLAAVAAQSCGKGGTTSPPACGYPHQIFTPAVPIGGRCTSAFSCLAGFCPSSSATCVACTPFVPVGQPCNASRLRCDFAVAFCGPLPSDGGVSRCEALLADDAPCTQQFECQSQWCSTRLDGGARCGAEPLGSSCWSDDACGPDAYCAGFSAMLTGSCVARLAPGAPCSNRTYDDGCVTGYTCLGGHCVTPPEASVPADGECETSFQCQDGLYCLSPGPVRGGACKPRAAVGAVCGQFDSCAVGASCLGGTCATKSPVDGGCTSNASCAPYLECRPPGSLSDGGVLPRVCQPYRREAERCGPLAFPLTCQALDGGRLLCARDGGVEGTCGATLPNGSACVLTTDCQSGRCANPDGGFTNRTCQPGC